MTKKCRIIQPVKGEDNRYKFNRHIPQHVLSNGFTIRKPAYKAEPRKISHRAFLVHDSSRFGPLIKCASQRSGSER